MGPSVSPLASIDKRAEAPDGYEYTQTTDYPAGAALKKKAQRARTAAPTAYTGSVAVASRTEVTNAPPLTLV